jgi:hypothetical protein
LTAKQRGRVLSSAIEALFEELRRMPELTRQHVERRVKEHLQDCLDRSHELAATLPKDKRSWDRDAEVAYLNKRIRDLTDTLADRDFTPALERDVLEILHPDDPDAEKGELETFEYACALVLRAKIQDAKLLLAELTGEPTRSTDPVFEGMRALGFPPLPGEARKHRSVVISAPYADALADHARERLSGVDAVAGFGEQPVVALHPDLEPGPRLYFPSTRPDSQRLKDRLEGRWIGELCTRTGVARADLPVLWDADFLLGPKDAEGHDTYVLCEINVSSVYPYPPGALAPLVALTLARARNRPRTV